MAIAVFAWGERFRHGQSPLLTTIKNKLARNQLPDSTASILTILERLGKSQGFQGLGQRAHDVIHSTLPPNDFKIWFQTELARSAIAGEHIRNMETLISDASKVFSLRLQMEQSFSETVRQSRTAAAFFLCGGAAGLISEMCLAAPDGDWQASMLGIGSALSILAPLFGTFGFLCTIIAVRQHFRFAGYAEDHDENAPALFFQWTPGPE